MAGATETLSKGSVLTALVEAQLHLVGDMAQSLRLRSSSAAETVYRFLALAIVDFEHQERQIEYVPGISTHGLCSSL